MTETISKSQVQAARTANDRQALDEPLQFALEIAPMPALASVGSQPKVERSVVEKLVQKLKEL